MKRIITVLLVLCGLSHAYADSFGCQDTTSAYAIIFTSALAARANIDTFALTVSETGYELDSVGISATNNGAGECLMHVGLYLVEEGSPTDSIADATITISTTDHKWWTAELSQSLTNGNTYTIAIAHGGSNNPKIYYFNGSGSNRSLNTGTVLNDPWTEDSQDQYYYCVKAWYHIEAGESRKVGVRK